VIFVENMGHVGIDRLVAKGDCKDSLGLGMDLERLGRSFWASLDALEETETSLGKAVAAVVWVLLQPDVIWADFDFVVHCGLTAVSFRHKLALLAFAGSCFEGACPAESHVVVEEEAEWQRDLLCLRRKDIAVPNQMVSVCIRPLRLEKSSIAYVVWAHAAPLALVSHDQWRTLACDAVESTRRIGCPTCHTMVNLRWTEVTGGQ
jgi:hypothetical protein